VLIELLRVVCDRKIVTISTRHIFVQIERRGRRTRSKEVASRSTQAGITKFMNNQ